jgi:hypothetical protein
MKLYLNERESKNENPRLESRGFFIIFETSEKLCLKVIELKF